MKSQHELDELWVSHNTAWRDPLQIISQWEDAATIDPRLLECTVHGAWWDVLASSGMTLLVTREYEDLVMGIGASNGIPQISYMALPHQSGLAVDLARGLGHI